jgi:4-hydroxybenzoate polyprenyltransferase
MAYLKIVRPLNLLLLFLSQFLIKFGLFEPLGVQLAMETFDFTLLVLATLSIAGAGNIINDIQDVAIDKVNKPNTIIVGREISEKSAYNYYFMLNIIGVATGFYLSNRLGHPGLAAVFILISALLYSYAVYLRSLLLVSNLIVSLLVATSLLVLIVFDVYPAIDTIILENQQIVAGVVLWYAFAAFYLNLIREIVKDIQDINGDKKGGRKTLPMVLGRTRTTQLVFTMGVFMLVGVLWFCYSFLYQFSWAVGYFVFLIAGPLLYFCLKSWRAEKPKEYQTLSVTLKVVMFTGVCSIPFFAEILNF